MKVTVLGKDKLRKRLSMDTLESKKLKRSPPNTIINKLHEKNRQIYINDSMWKFKLETFQTRQLIREYNKLCSDTKMESSPQAGAQIDVAIRGMSNPRLLLAIELKATAKIVVKRQGHSSQFFNVFDKSCDGALLATLFSFDESGQIHAILHIFIRSISRLHRLIKSMGYEESTWPATSFRILYRLTMNEQTGLITSITFRPDTVHLFSRLGDDCAVWRIQHTQDQWELIAKTAKKWQTNDSSISWDTFSTLSTTTALGDKHEIIAKKIILSLLPQKKFELKPSTTVTGSPEDFILGSVHDDFTNITTQVRTIRHKDPSRQPSIGLQYKRNGKKINYTSETVCDVMVGVKSCDMQNGDVKRQWNAPHGTHVVLLLLDSQKSPLQERIGELTVLSFSPCDLLQNIIYLDKQERIINFESATKLVDCLYRQKCKQVPKEPSTHDFQTASMGSYMEAFISSTKGNEELVDSMCVQCTQCLERYAHFGSACIQTTSNGKDNLICICCSMDITLKHPTIQAAPKINRDELTTWIATNGTNLHGICFSCDVELNYLDSQNATDHTLCKTCIEPNTGEGSCKMMNRVLAEETVARMLCHFSVPLFKEVIDFART